MADEGELRLLKQDVMKELLEELFGRRDEEFCTVWSTLARVTGTMP